MEQKKVSRYPLDYETLKKGDVITVKQIEEIVHKRRYDADFWSATLSLAQEIETRLRDLNRVWVVRHRKGNLVILDDTSASTFLEHDTKRLMFSKLKKRFHQMTHVETEALEPGRREEHMRLVERVGLAMTGMRLGWRGKLQLAPHQDRRPRLNGEMK